MNVSPSHWSWTIAVLVGVLSLGCLGADAPVATSSAQKIEVQGRPMQFQTQGTGRPTLVIETGLGEPGVNSGSWKAVLDSLSRSNRIFQYDRAGLGGSAAPAKTPRTIRDQAEDLHQLLVQTKEPGPFVLVGHSMGGLVVRGYAAEHPEQVAGIVLVDSSHPDQWKRWLAALPPETPSEPPSIRGARKHLTATLADPQSNPENLDLAASADQIRALGTLGSIPLRVVTHSPKWVMVPDLPEPVSQQIEQDWQDLQKSLLALSTASRQSVAASAGHYVQAEDPALVIAAIQDLLAALPSKSP
ncbi:MAG: alpha/beta hydrolase [Verrucomicrobia bacterium]|nr:alpha/beta hydrolase [Verrucomicrobiota bacterium]